MLFTQDRRRLRFQFLQAWRKHLAQKPLEPLETQIVSLLLDHPEYHALLESHTDILEADYTADHGGDNPFLHLSLHLALREQVGTDRPAGIASVTRSLLIKHGNGHQVEHLMIECLGEYIWDAQRQGRAPDEQAYLEKIRGLV